MEKQLPKNWQDNLQIGLGKPMTEKDFQAMCKQQGKAPTVVGGNEDIMTQRGMNNTSKVSPMVVETKTPEFQAMCKQQGEAPTVVGGNEDIMTQRGMNNTSKVSPMVVETKTPKSS